MQLNDVGVYIGGFQERLTNTRYADDVLLYAKSLEELQRMTELLIIELRKVGLHLNADKTKILHSSIHTPGADRDYVDINGEFVQVLHEVHHHRYLGRHISLSAENRTQVEFQHRQQRAWASFHKHKKVLLERHVSLTKRLHLFDICVAPSVLFALIAFPFTRRQLDILDALQRKMLRRIVGWRRVDGEPWDETMRRMKKRIEDARQLYNWQLWSCRFFRDQWRFAVHLWTAASKPMLMYNFYSCFDINGMNVPHRDVGRPRMKWDDNIKSCFHHFSLRVETSIGLIF